MFQIEPIRTKPNPSHENWALPEAKPLLVQALPLFDAPSAELPPGRLLDLRFTGKARDYFQIWVITQLLTVLTLGLYGPWSRTRRAAYLAKHWQLDGEGFDVRYQPLQMFYGRLLLIGIGLATWFITATYPLYLPLLLLVFMWPAPKILAKSYAFRWRTLSYRGIGFSATTEHHTLIWPVALLAIAISFNQLPYDLLPFQVSEVWQEVLKGMVAPLFLFFYCIPRATSALTHLRFSLASYGVTPFVLHTSPKAIFKNTIRATFNRVLWFWIIVLAILMVVTYARSNIDFSAISYSIIFLLLSVFGVTYARARRLNFVLSRVTLGGLGFRSTLNAHVASRRALAYALLAICTLGLSIPWSTVHFSRWRAGQWQVYLEGEWSQFALNASNHHHSGAFDEVAAYFDLETGI